MHSGGDGQHYGHKFSHGSHHGQGRSSSLPLSTEYSLRRGAVGGVVRLAALVECAGCVGVEWGVDGRMATTDIEIT